METRSESIPKPGSINHESEQDAPVRRLHPPFRLRVSSRLQSLMDIVRQQANHGWIEVITGSMFSGKSEELIRRLRRAQIARQKVQIFKPAFDDRHSTDHIVSHSEMRLRSENVAASRELVSLVDEDTEVVGIDEGQFFDEHLPAVC